MAQASVVAFAWSRIPEIIDLLRRHSAISQVATLGRGRLRGIRDTLREWSVVPRCSGIGCLIGAMPGLGGSVADWMAYGYTVQLAKDKSQFGRGDVRGVLAPESANNAVSGGAGADAALRHPGPGSTAIFLGGMVLLGIQPGIMLVETQLDLVYTVIWTLAIANVVGAGLCFAASPFVARITTLPYAYVAPFMLMVIFFAAYQATSHWGDILALLAIGVLGLYMRRFGWPRLPLIVGFVLAPGAENHSYQAIQFHGWAWVLRPGVLIIGAITVVDVAGARYGRAAIDEGGASGRVRDIRPQLAFCDCRDGAVRVCGARPAALVVPGKGVPARCRDRGASGCAFCRRRHLARVARELGDLRYRVRNGSRRNCARPLFALDRRVARRERLFGFLIGLALFFAAFLHLEARAPTARNAVLTASAVLFLAAMSYSFVLDFPRGLLQELVEMPWPLR